MQAEVLLKCCWCGFTCTLEACAGMGAGVLLQQVRVACSRPPTGHGSNGLLHLLQLVVLSGQGAHCGPSVDSRL